MGAATAGTGADGGACTSLLPPARSLSHLSACALASRPLLGAGAMPLVRSL